MSELAADGLLLVEKTGGVTSHDVVDAVRRGCRKIRVGHAGTLDPMATGLMVVCLGRATRLQRYLTEMGKRYIGEIRLGFATTTYDAEGEPINPQGDPSSVDAARLDQVFSTFLGEIDQVSPPYSAKKIAGRRLYDMARKGEPVPTVSKKVRISRFTPGPLAGDRIGFTIDCSAGTYVRAIAHDVGLALGIGAHVSALRRTRIGDFDVENAVTAANWVALPPEERYRLPHFVGLDTIPLPFPRVELDARQEKAILRGQKALLRLTVRAVAGTQLALANAENHLLAIGEVESSDNGWAQVQPRIVLAEEG